MFYTNPFYGGHTFEIGVLFASDKALPIYHSVAQIRFSLGIKKSLSGEPNCEYLPLCLDTNAGNDTFFQNSWILVPFNVHYQQNTVELQHFLPMFRYSVQNS